MSVLQSTLNSWVNLEAVSTLAERLEEFAASTREDAEWLDDRGGIDRMLAEAKQAARVAAHLRDAIKEAAGLPGGW